MRIHNYIDRLSRNLPHFALAASITIFLAIVLGGITRANEAGMACAGWPFCGGEITPPLDSLGRLAYIHRILSGLGAFFLLIAVFVSSLRIRHERLINRSLLIAVVLMGIQILGGRSLALFDLPASATALHLGLSLAVLASTSAATTALYYRARTGSLPERFRLSSPFSRLAVITLIAVLVMLVSGAIVSATGATAACPEWPLCSGSLLPFDMAAWINILHRILVAISGMLMAGMLVQAWRTQRSQTPVIVSATIAAVLFFAQALL